MDRIKRIRRVLVIIGIFLAVEFAMLIAIVRPSAVFLWATIAVIAVLCIFLIAICIGLLNELKESDKNKKQ